MISDLNDCEAKGFGQTLQKWQVHECETEENPPKIIKWLFFNEQSLPSEFVRQYDTHHHGEKSLCTNATLKRKPVSLLA